MDDKSSAARQSSIEGSRLLRVRTGRMKLEIDRRTYLDAFETFVSVEVAENVHGPVGIAVSVEDHPEVSLGEGWRF